MKPTDEQKEAILHFGEGDDLAIQAGAGTGKTSTLNLLAKYNKAKGQYIAFNKAIVEEAKEKFPKSVSCRTAHSLAYGAVGYKYKNRMGNTGRVKSVEIGNRFRMKPVRLTRQDGTVKMFSVSQQGSLINRSITSFCQSGDVVIRPSHVPWTNGIDMPGYRDNNRKVAEVVFPHLAAAWADLQSESHGFMPFSHSHYLKMWQLQEPHIDAEFILFDECQDANPVLLSIVEQQKHAQRVFVGDSAQQIYEFTGAINAFDRINAANEVFLTQSFRFGPEIAEAANKMLELIDTPLRLKGLDSIKSVIGAVDDPDVILCRTNAKVIETALELQAAGKVVAITGGGSDLLAFAKGASDLMTQRWTTHPELACFKSWDEVQDYIDNDDSGGDLKLMVGLIDRYGVGAIINVINKTVQDERGADITISTAHKSKGREWNSVRLAEDFPDPEKMNASEYRLLYVAVTRAMNNLELSTSVESVLAQ
jgi:hypothetical protein